MKKHEFSFIYCLINSLIYSVVHCFIPLFYRNLKFIWFHSFNIYQFM